MKKILYIVSFIGLFLTLQSCDRLSGLISGESNSRSEKVTDERNQTDSADNDKQGSDSTGSVATAKMQSQLQQNEDGIKKLNDSLAVLNSNLANLQSDIEALQKQQKEIENDKVGVKNLFVYLAIFSVIIIGLVVLLSKKIAGKGSLTEKQVKDIIADFSKRHPEVIGGSFQSTLNQYFGYIQNHKQAIDAINKQLGALVTNVNGLASGISNQQSWEKQAAEGGQQEKKDIRKDEAGRIFYMKRPLNDREFDLSLRKETATEDTMYRFEIDRKRPNIAHFVFDCNSQSRVRWALSTKDKTLDRVCNASGSGANGKYKCTAPGEAELRDGKWVVTRKAVVIFD